MIRLYSYCVFIDVESLHAQQRISDGRQKNRSTLLVEKNDVRMSFVDDAAMYL